MLHLRLCPICVESITFYYEATWKLRRKSINKWCWLRKYFYLYGKNRSKLSFEHLRLLKKERKLVPKGILRGGAWGLSPPRITKNLWFSWGFRLQRILSTLPPLFVKLYLSFLKFSTGASLNVYSLQNFNYNLLKQVTNGEFLIKYHWWMFLSTNYYYVNNSKQIMELVVLKRIMFHKTQKLGSFSMKNIYW